MPNSLPAFLAAALALGACADSPVLLPIEVKDSTTIASARASWHAAPESAGTRAFSPGFELEYERGLGQSDQKVGANEIIRLDNKVLSGPQDVRHYADLRRGHFAFNGIVRPGNPEFELEMIAGLGQAHLGLRSESQTTPADSLAATLTSSGVVIGAGPRWNFTEAFAIEARFQSLYSSPSSDGRLWYREIALRYRPMKTLAVRAGYAEMDFRPSQQQADSPVHVRVYGPLLGLNLMF